MGLLNRKLKTCRSTGARPRCGKNRRLTNLTLPELYGAGGSARLFTRGSSLVPGSQQRREKRTSRISDPGNYVSDRNFVEKPAFFNCTRCLGGIGNPLTPTITTRNLPEFSTGLRATVCQPPGGRRSTSGLPDFGLPDSRTPGFTESQSLSQPASQPVQSVKQPVSEKVILSVIVPVRQ